MEVAPREIPGGFWLSLSNNFHLIPEEHYLGLREIVQMRLLIKNFIKKWWDLEDRKGEYYDWSIVMTTKLADLIKKINQEWDEEL